MISKADEEKGREKKGGDRASTTKGWERDTNFKAFQAGRSGTRNNEEAGD